MPAVVSTITASFSARTRTILARFPRHLALDEPGTLFGAVVAALGDDLERQTVQLGRIRRAHRIGHADERRDLLLLAGLHGLGAVHLDLIDRRLLEIGGLRTALVAGDDAAATAAIAALPAVLALPADPFPAWPGDAVGAARARLAQALAALIDHDERLDLGRECLRGVIDLHRAGNGTIGALLGAGATYLGLELRTVAHAEDGYWHLARCLDTLCVVQPNQPGTSPSEIDLEPLPDLLALEENPFTPAGVTPEDRLHAAMVTVARIGFDVVPVTVIVIGREDRTVRPLVVNVDTGHALTYIGNVPDGGELRFSASGRATLDGAEVGRFCYVIQGGVFADALASHLKDFVFADASDPTSGGDRVAAFGVTGPFATALDPGAAFPHAGGLLPPATLAVGETRWKVFAREGCFGTERPTPEPAIPRFDAAEWDGTVFAAATAGGPSLKLGFAWQEREAYACTLWLPMRFARLDHEGVTGVCERMRVLLGRHRPAGVHITVAYADDLWSLGEGIVRGNDSTAAEGVIVVGTRLWPDGTPQPTP